MLLKLCRRCARIPKVTRNDQGGILHKHWRATAARAVAASVHLYAKRQGLEEIHARHRSSGSWMPAASEWSHRDLVWIQVLARSALWILCALLGYSSSTLLGFTWRGRAAELTACVGAGPCTTSFGSNRASWPV